MLIIVPQSEVRPSSSSGEAEVLGLAGVLFCQEYKKRDDSLGALRLLSPGEENRVQAWVDVSPNRSVATGEPDLFDWLKIPSRRRLQPPTPPVPRTPPAITLIEYPAPAFSAIKSSRATTVNGKTDSLIAAGFTVDGKTFSASDTAQLKWLGMYTSRADLSYPVTVPTKDDLSFVSLIEAADIATYYAALLARIQTVLSGGVTLKALIAAAPDQAALDAIVDNRT